MENIANQLESIISSGYYNFILSSSANNGYEIELVYPLLPATAITDTPEEVRSWNRWKREEIEDFVRKIGLLDTTCTSVQREQILCFIIQNEVS